MRGKAGQVGSKKYKPIPTPTIFARWEKLMWGEARRGGLSGVGQNCHP